MKNFTLPFIAFLLLQFTSFAQTPDTIWTKTFGGVDYDCGYSVKQTSDGGYIIAAYSKSFSTLIGDLWLIKTNNYGDTLWTKIFAGCAGIGNMSVQQTTDGGYIIVSETAYDDVWLIRTDSLGNTLWIKIFDTGFWDGGRSVVQTEDGGYIIAAYTREPPHLWLLKTDSFGDTVWTKEYQGDGFALQKTYDRGYIVTGLINPGASDIWLLKTDELGNTLWTKTFGGTGIDFGCSVQQTTDGGYIITGNTVIAGGAQIWLIKTDSLGDTVWIRNFGTLDNINRSSDVQQTTDGGYIITGWTNAFGAGSVDVWLIKTDEDGGIIWSKTFGGTSSDGSNSIQLTADSGYIITGWTSSFGAGNGDVWLIKTTPDTTIVSVELTSFTATRNVNKISLNWLTSTETNNTGFEIERKQDNNNWERVGFVEGHGTTTEPQEYSYVDDISKLTSNSLAYRLKQIDFDGSFEYSDVVYIDNLTPIDFILHQNFPNPFNPVTTIKYQILKLSFVTLKVYDILGSEIATLINEEKSAGNYQVKFNASNLPSGVYFYQLKAGSFIQTKEMILLK